jgi:WhiB family redox-sensing transcriptional regulator
MTPAQEHARAAAAELAYPDIQGEALWPGRRNTGRHQTRPHTPPTNRQWMQHGACLNHPVDLWFTTKGGTVRQAQMICGVCVVRGRCAEFAVEEMIVHGVWGGLTPRQRRPLQVAHNKAAS